MSTVLSQRDYQRIERAIRYIADHYRDQPSLAQIAHAANMSPFHFQRLFKRWAGVSPKKFAQYLSLEHAKHLLQENRDILTSSLEAGLSGPGRLHDLFVTFEAMSPGEYKKKGLGLEVRYGFHETPFGLALIGVTPRGICHLSFPLNKKSAIAEMKAALPRAKFIQNQKSTSPVVDSIFYPKPSRKKIRVLTYGSPFQIKVWEALLKIPRGHIVSYQDLAKIAGVPKATRATGSAVAANSIAYLIPCHRVIRSTGVIGQYRWGEIRKQAILGFEQAK